MLLRMNSGQKEEAGVGLCLGTIETSPASIAPCSLTDLPVVHTYDPRAHTGGTRGRSLFFGVSVCTPRSSGRYGIRIVSFREVSFPKLLVASYRINTLAVY